MGCMKPFIFLFDCLAYYITMCPFISFLYLVYHSMYYIDIDTSVKWYFSQGKIQLVLYFVTFLSGQSAHC